MCVYTGKKIRSVFDKNLLMELAKKEKRKKKKKLLTQVRPLSQFMSFKNLCFYFFKCRYLVTNQTVQGDLLIKVNILPFPSYLQPSSLRQPLLTAPDSSSSGGWFLHDSSSIWYACTLFHDLSTSDGLYWISSSNCTFLASSISEMHVTFFSPPPFLIKFLKGLV